MTEKKEIPQSDKRKISESFEPIPISERHHASTKSRGTEQKQHESSPVQGEAAPVAPAGPGDTIKKEELDAHIKTIPMHKDHQIYLKTTVGLSPQAFFQAYLGCSGPCCFS